MFTGPQVKGTEIQAQSYNSAISKD